jgi:mannitol-1-phosphate 5-dehydrogenase
MISRVVPRPEPDPLVIVTEDYNEWTARAETFKGEKPANLSALELVPNQTARLERKLFIHNGGHAVCGYIGYHRGHRYIHEALQDPVVLEHVLRALDELGEVVRCKHGFSAESIDAYKKDLGRRGSISELKDEISRVVRDPIRKLSSRERLVAPALLAGEYRLSRQWIVKGIVAALKYQDVRDEQSLVLGRALNQQGLAEVLKEISTVEPGSDLSEEIHAAWETWDL